MLYVCIYKLASVRTRVGGETGSGFRMKLIAGGGYGGVETIIKFNYIISVVRPLTPEKSSCRAPENGAAANAFRGEENMYTWHTPSLWFSAGSGLSRGRTSRRRRRRRVALL